MRKHYKKLLEIETFKIKDQEMLMLNSMLLKTDKHKDQHNVKNTNYNTNRTLLKEINKSLSLRMFKI